MCVRVLTLSSQHRIAGSRSDFNRTVYPYPCLVLVFHLMSAYGCERVCFEAFKCQGGHVGVGGLFSLSREGPLVASLS